MCRQSVKGLMSHSSNRGPWGFWNFARLCKLYCRLTHVSDFPFKAGLQTRLQSSTYKHWRRHWVFSPQKIGGLIVHSLYQLKKNRSKSRRKTHNHFTSRINFRDSNVLERRNPRFLRFAHRFFFLSFFAIPRFSPALLDRHFRSLPRYHRVRAPSTFVLLTRLVRAANENSLALENCCHALVSHMCQLDCFAWVTMLWLFFFI